MSKCIRCNLEILDNTEKCPLCHRALNLDGFERNVYPDTVRSTKRFRTMYNIILFLSIVVASISVIVNITLEKDMPWSGIVVLFLIYVNVSLKLMLTGKSNHIFKTVFLPLIGVAVLIGIDYFSGYYGWAINYVFPCCICLINLVILILVLANRRNWQQYMMSQILMIVLSLGYGLLYLVNFVHIPELFWISLGFSFFPFMGTLIIGDYRARSELHRRFHL